MQRVDLPQFFCVALELVIVRCPRTYPVYLQSGVCLARLDPRGWFVLLSPAWQSVLGFGCDELHGRGLLELLPPAKRRSGEAAWRRILNPAEADPLDLELCRKDGSPQPMRWYRRFDPYDATLFIVAESVDLISSQCRAPSPPGPA
jgi:PAS domain S-box-containing protein